MSLFFITIITSQVIFNHASLAQLDLSHAQSKTSHYPFSCSVQSTFGAISCSHVTQHGVTCSHITTPLTQSTSPTQLDLSHVRSRTSQCPFSCNYKVPSVHPTTHAQRYTTWSEMLPCYTSLDSIHNHMKTASIGDYVSVYTFLKISRDNFQDLYSPHNTFMFGPKKTSLF
jgi:hypothetical protein